MIKHPKRTLDGAIGSYLYSKHCSQKYEESRKKQAQRVAELMNLLGKRHYRSRYGVLVFASRLDGNGKIIRITIKE